MRSAVRFRERARARKTELLKLNGFRFTQSYFQAHILGQGQGQGQGQGKLRALA